MIKLKRFFILILALAAVAVTVAVFPFAPQKRAFAASADPDSNFYFWSIDVNIEVRKDKTFRITERLEVVFKRGDVNTGIIRDIQRISRTSRVVDGKVRQGGQYIAGLSDVELKIDGEAASVGIGLYDSGQFHSVTMERADGGYFPSSFDVGETSLFELSYTYDMSDDPVGDFVFDVLGYEMAQVDGEFTATVKFPEPLDASQVSVRSNRLRAWTPDGEDGEYFTVAGDTVSLRAAGRGEGRGLTVQVLLPDGYFSEAVGVTFTWLYLIAMIGLVAGMAGAFSLVMIYRARRPIAPVTLFPPESMTLARASAVWHNKSRRKDMAAYFLKWAALELVTLERDGKEDFIATRTEKPTDDSTFTEQEAAVFAAVFPRGEAGEIFSTREMSKNKTGQYALSSAISLLQTAADKPSPLVKGKSRFSVLMCLCMLLPMIGVFIYYCAMLASALPILFLIFIAAGTFVGTLAIRGREPIMFVIPVLLAGVPLGVFGGLFYIGIYDFAGLFFVAIAWWAMSWGLHLLFGRRTEAGQREYGELLGFRNFLLTAEISRIEALIDETPSYFYNVLPYCLVLGIGDKVQKRYAVLGKALPAWAEWEMGTFCRAVSRTSRYFAPSTGGSGIHHHGGGGGRHGSHGGGGGGGGSRGAGRRH